MASRFFLWVLPLAAVSFAGCSYLPAIGPNYKRTALNLPSAYQEGNAAKLTSSPLPYWQRLNDPTLNQLMEMVEKNSLVTQQAWQRVKQARAGSSMAWSTLGPSLQASGGYQGERIGAQANLVNGTTQTLDVFSAGIGAQWELDILGGNRRALQSAKARAEAAQAQADGIRSMVMAEVARQYFTYVSLNTQLELTKTQAAATKQIAEKVGQQARVGLVQPAIAAGADANYHAIAARLPQIKAAREATRYNLEALLGRQPGALEDFLAPDKLSQLPGVPTSTSLVLPSELISLRPDVRAHEYAAQAATYEVGVAMADLFPRFSLNGYYGVQGPEPGNLNQPSALVWNGGPAFRWTVFSMGRVWNNVKLQKSKRKEAVLAYQQSVLDALAEVETRLAQSKAAEESLLHSTVMEENMLKIKNAADNQHQKGLINGIQAGQADVRYLDAAAAKNQSHLAALLSYINLHQSFGL